MPERKTAEARALLLVGRYARLQARSIQCRCATNRLLDKCENLRHFGDGEAPGSSGCMMAYQDCKDEMSKGHANRPVSQEGWDALLEELEFCRPCMLAMKVWRHRKMMHRRRASVLGAMRRLGASTALSGA